jgi:uncharacterized membrane protein YqiK
MSSEVAKQEYDQALLQTVQAIADESASKPDAPPAAAQPLPSDEHSQAPDVTPKRIATTAPSTTPNNDDQPSWFTTSEWKQFMHTFAVIASIIVICLLITFLYKQVLYLFGVVVISDNQVGIVTKKWVLVGKYKTLPDGSLIALNGEAGIQADTLAPGLHFGYWIFQYSIEKVPFMTIPTGHIGVVEARDGFALSGRVLAKTIDCNSYQDARKFLANGGQRGPQISIIPPGTYRINTRLFDVSNFAVLEIPDNKVGIVTTKEGAPLKNGEIAGKRIDGHNMYQDPEAFLAAGGEKGLQEQPILAGRYFINPKFATVEMVPLTEVEIAHVGVVISYVGDAGVDVTGVDFRHGNLVSRGHKGVWASPLDPGRYPINPYTHKVEIVPTANIVLNWADDKSEAHNLDSKLSTIKVRSSDGFSFDLDVSQIIHVPYDSAPKVIARFGTMLALVTQVLEPTIGNYFRNAAQTSDVIDFLKERSVQQEKAKVAISTALKEYDVNAIDTLIGDIDPPEALMKTLTDRKIAEQENVTYETQTKAEETRKNLEQAKAIANTQARVVDSERSVQIAQFNANAIIEEAKGAAESKKINAEADANVLVTVGDATATKTKAVGNAEAEVIRLKVSSMDADNFARVQMAQAFADGHVQLVPQIVTGGGANGQGGGLVELLFAEAITGKNLLKPNNAPAGQPSEDNK